MKKKLLLAVLSGLGILAACMFMVTFSKSNETVFLDSNVDALTMTDFYLRHPCQFKWERLDSGYEDNGQIFVCCDNWTNIDPDTIYSCELAYGIPYSEGACIFDKWF